MNGNELRKKSHARRTIRTGVLLLDLDGTLIDNSKRLYGIYRTYLRGRGRAALPLASYWRLKRSGMPEVDIISKTDANPPDAKSYSTWKSKMAERKESLATDRLFPGTKKTLAQLKKKGFKLVLLTLRKNTTNLAWQLSHLGLAPYLDEVKLAPKGKDTLVRRLVRRKAFADAVIVGDAESDIRCARQCGMRAIAVTSGVRNRTRLERHGPQAIITGFGKILGILKTGPTGE